MTSGMLSQCDYCVLLSKQLQQKHSDKVLALRTLYAMIEQLIWNQTVTVKNSPEVQSIKSKPHAPHAWRDARLLAISPSRPSSTPTQTSSPASHPGVRGAMVGGKDMDRSLHDFESREDILKSQTKTPHRGATGKVSYHDHQAHAMHLPTHGCCGWTRQTKTTLGCLLDLEIE
jgi:hypothetical protein